jgi:CheY-like chemotaxis protein
MESIGTLAGGLAHDLNNTLMPVMMATDLLQSEETDPVRLSMLETVASGSRHAAEMVRQIVSFAAGLEGRRLPVDIGALLCDVEHIANDTFLKTIRVVREEADEVWPVIGDPTQLHQVLINLCVNARDAMPAGGTLVLAADVVVDEHDDVAGDEASPGRYVRIRVEDDGEGMAAEVLDRIFEPFFTTKERGRGTGLGLSTSAGIIRSHGGFMRVDSAPGAGTRFCVYLPASADTVVPRPEPATSARPRGGGELVLVVDDEARIRTLVNSVLTASGYRVMEAVDGASALSVLSGVSPVDVVVTDMMMPGIDGLDTVRALRRTHPDLPVVLVSGLHPQTMIDEAAELGVRHVLSKPFTATTLLQTLREVLEPTR